MATCSAHDDDAGARDRCGLVHDRAEKPWRLKVLLPLDEFLPGCGMTGIRRLDSISS
jgi:hypothetical protein